jgi:hypothetical protein
MQDEGRVLLCSQRILDQGQWSRSGRRGEELVRAVGVYSMQALVGSVVV